MFAKLIHSAVLFTANPDMAAITASRKDKLTRRFKSAPAATLLALATILAPPAASARVTVSSDRTPANAVHDHRTPVVVHDHRTGTVVHDHRTGTVVQDHRTGSVVQVRRTSPRRSEVVIAHPRMDCRAGTLKLRKMGYRAISAYDCSGERYHYTAMMGTTLFGASMVARTGTLDLRLIGIVR